MSKKKKCLIGFTTKDWDLLFTVSNTLNLSAIIQKTREEAMARYDDDCLGKNVRKIKITVEEI
jgi:hypothetical protein